MRKFIVKYFALDYLVRVFGKGFNFVRAATIIFPLVVLNGLVIQDTLIFLIPLGIAIYLGFFYFRKHPVKWEELDKEQKWMYGVAVHKGVLTEDVPFTKEMFNEWSSINNYILNEVGTKRFHRPGLVIFHPVVAVTISIILAIIIL